MTTENPQETRKISLKSSRLQEVLDEGDYGVLPDLKTNHTLKIISRNNGFELASIILRREGEESYEHVQLHYDPQNLRQIASVLMLRYNLEVIGQEYEEFPSRAKVAKQIIELSGIYAEKVLGGSRQ